jgi:HEAT repeat protein
MKCEDYRAQLPEYWEGALEEDENAGLEMHLASCAACRAEAGSLGPIWHRLAHIPLAQPSPAMRRRFYERLDAYQQGLLESPSPAVAPAIAARPGFADRLRAWFPMRPAFQIAFGAAVLAIGFFAGYHLDDKRDNTQLSQLRAEVNNMRQMVTLSLLQQQNASERLKGVNWSYRVEQSDTEVLAALLYTVNHDANVNVRLAAIDALHTFSDSPIARKGLVQAIVKQESPMVQVALIDTLAELHDPQALPALQALSKDPMANAQVRQRAQWALGKMQ